jgi:hypothetical protein
MYPESVSLFVGTHICWRCGDEVGVGDVEEGGEKQNECALFCLVVATREG